MNPYINAILVAANTAVVAMGVNIYMQHINPPAPEQVIISVQRPTPKPVVVPMPVTKIVVPTNILNEEVLCLAHNIYHEARGEPEEGRIMVGQVTINRAERGYRGHTTICEVVHARKQFSWTLDKPYVDLSNPTERAALLDALELASGLLDNAFDDQTQGASHYYALEGMKTGEKPYWADDYTVVAEVGKHTFLK